MDSGFYCFGKIGKDGKVNRKEFLEFSNVLGFPYLGNLNRSAFRVIAKGREIIFFEDLKRLWQGVRTGREEERCEILFKFLTENTDCLKFDLFCRNLREIQRFFKKLTGFGKRLSELECKKVFEKIDGNGLDGFKKVYFSESCYVEWNKFIFFDFILDESPEPDDIDCYFDLIINALSLGSKKIKENVFFNTFPSIFTQNPRFHLSSSDPEISWNEFKEKIALTDTTVKKVFLTVLTENMVHISRTSLPKPLKTNPEDLEPTLSWFLLSGVFKFFRSKSLKTEVQTVFKEGKILTSFRIISHFSPELRELLTSEEIEDILSETSVEKALSLSIFQDFSMNPWMKSSGKSDGNFLLTNSQKFLFKSISDPEFEFLESFIEKYSSYVKENKETFICKVFGVFTLKKFKEWKRRKLRFLMMKFLLQGFDDSDLVFDLKGSTVGRNNFQACQTMNPLKDLNFIESGLRIDLNEKDKERVIHQLTNDCEFLQKLSIIDYSLIVAIKRITSQDRQKGSGFFSKCGEFYYVFGIIDYFTVFGYRKQLEMIFKNSVYGSGVSCCPPDQYASRFMTFIQTIFV